ncbi:TM-glycoprotein [Ball python nidovirus 1]|uniref:TM-glycoprotein n=1 Tax=Ball python nidovirus TaxID=1986118 RepID=A0A076PY88_9NIDO|nr:TM-glycoprotein [Ball python nidovirus 1]AIJ50570.1 TM-glycoprotein [Ball python nidovirus 1]
MAKKRQSCSCSQLSSLTSDTASPKRTCKNSPPTSRRGCKQVQAVSPRTLAVKSLSTYSSYHQELRVGLLFHLNTMVLKLKRKFNKTIVNMVECSVRLLLLLLLIVSILCVSNVNCGFNGTYIEPRNQNPINHPFMLWNSKSFVCMTCFNESGKVYYYHPKIDINHPWTLKEYVLAEWVSDGWKPNPASLTTPQLLFNHYNRTFFFYNSSVLSLVGEKFIVNQSLYFDNLSPYYLKMFNVSSGNISQAYMMWNNRYLVDTYANWLKSPINTTVVLGDLFQPNIFRFINYRNGTLSPNVALRFNINASLGYPRYFPSIMAKQQSCPTKAPQVMVRTCKPEIRTVTVIKTVTKAAIIPKKQEQATTAIPSDSPQLLECKQQLNIFVVLFVVVSCVVLLILMVIMCRYTNQAQKPAKSRVY